MNWEKLFLKYVWNDQTTPYLVPVEKLNRRQGNSEILIYSLFLGVFFGAAALMSLRGGPEGRSLGIAYYGFSVVCAAALFTIMKSYPAALYLSATPAVALVYLYAYGLGSEREIIAESVSGFTISYFDADGVPVTSLPAAYAFGNPPPQALKDIRRICVAVTSQSERPPPTGTGAATMSLSTCVTPRNLAVEETALDAAPPSTPAGLTVADTGSCTDKLCARWDRNPETDLAGYVLYYGAGAVTVPVASLSDPGNPRTYLNPSDLAITKDADRVFLPTTYSVSIAAYDSSGNYSAISAAVSGNPADERDCVGGTEVDTTVNPDKPTPPLNMNVLPGSEKELVISWTPPGDGSVTVGYRLYRSEEEFAEGPSPIDPSFLIANETTLTPDVTTFTDAGLTGCQDYYYAVASINCDETLVTSYEFYAAGGDYASASGQPEDLTPPLPTSLADTRAGFMRIFLDFDNPLVEEAEDFNRTEIYFNASSQCPSLQPGGNVSSGTLIPDNDSGTPGTFVSPGTQTVVFDHPSEVAPDTPLLDNNGQYCLLSVAYDDCENTALDSSSLVLVDLCGDDPVGPPPDWPINPTYSSCSPEWVKITWDYPPKDYTDAARIFDFAGYRIWRTGPEAGVQTELTDGPTWGETWTDGRDLQEGGQYRYEVRATDCVYENDHANFPNNYSTALFIPSDSTWVSPGRLTLFEGYADTPLAAENFVTTFSDSSQPFTFHNNIRFFLQNTSRATMTMETIALEWGNPNVLLDSVTVGGPPSTTALNVRPTGGVPSGAPVSRGEPA